MMDFADLDTVTLIVKAPNQRIEDQTVECMLEWTVRKLKEHLSNVYPNKPKEIHQRIIYSGKLLRDDLKLKDVLREYEEEGTSSHHTVHLVCSPVAGESLEGEPNITENISNPTTVPLSSDVRYRGPASNNMYQPVTTTQMFTAMPQPHDVGASAHNPWSQYMTMMGGTYPHMHPQAAAHYSSPEQQQYMMWQQQMYAQYMSQYMQYYQGYPPTMPHDPTVQPPLPHLHHNLPNQAQPQQPAQPGRRNNANLVMNAQGGQMEEEDDEFGQRDWLDLVYMFCRFGVLLSIVYFYSTFSRSVMVFLFFFAIYLYQAGWLNFLRRAPAAEPAAQPNNQQQAQLAEQPQPQPQPGPIPIREDDPHDQPDGDANPDTPPADTVPAPAAPPAPVEPQGPGALSVLWCFVVTFFTSLVPQRPAALNAN